MAAVVGLVGLLVLVPLAVQLLATGQATISQQSVDQQDAIEAAHAGLSDYINRLEGATAYLKYCSKGTFACSTSGLTGVDAANPGFADTAGANTWAYVENTGSAGYQAYHYVVDTDGADPTATTPQSITVFVTGRGGVSRYVYQTLKVSLLATPGITYSSGTWSSSGSSSSVSNTSCTSTAVTITVPHGVSSAMVSASGAQGGASTGGLGGGGHGATEVAYPPVSPGQVLSLLPGCPGASGNFELLGVNLYGGGGIGGLGGVNWTLNVGGGNGGSAGITLLSGTGGGGGGASAVCFGTACSSSTPLCAVVGGSLSPNPCVVAVAGGGGGDGGPSIGWTAGHGGYWQNGLTWTADGQSGTGLLNSGGAGGAAGGDSTSTGAPGLNFLAVLDGAGGGGGGGFPKGGAAGHAGGILGVALGAGGGGGLGDSSASPSCGTGCPGASTSTVITDPGPCGSVTVTFFTPGTGGSLKGSVLQYTVTTQLVRPVPPNSTS
jgi:hypothetical protein